MEIIIEYHIREKYNHNVSEICKLVVSEADILQIARERATVPMCYGNIEDSENKYELSNFNIDEIRGLR